MALSMVRPTAGFSALLFLLSGAAALPAAASPVTYNFLSGIPDDTPTNPLYTGPGVLSRSGATTAAWNMVNYSGSEDLNITTNAQDDAGNITPVMIQYRAQGQNNNPFTEPVAPTSAQALLANYAVSKNGKLDSIDLSGLPPGVPFTLVFYGTNGPSSHGERQTQFSLLSGEAGRSGTRVLKQATTTETTNTRFESPGNYVEMTGTTDAQGRVFAAFVGVGGASEGNFSGLQIQINKP